MEFQLALRRRGVSDKAVLRAMDEVPRELFVEPDDRADAYADTALPIACGQTISQPFVVAYVSEQAQVKPEHRVLEIGAGSGYQAAVLAHLAREVVALERFRTLAERAGERLRALGLLNAEVLIGDGYAPPELGSFDRIVVSAAMEEAPAALTDLLAPDGVMIAPIGPMDGPQTLTRIVRGERGFETEGLIAVRFVPALRGVARQL